MMYLIKVLILVTFLCLVLAEYRDIENNAFIQEVDIGKNAILKCKSNDDNKHVFLFWQNQKRGIVISPSNIYDKNKYDFDVLTGNLTIRDARPADEGLYNCISDGLDDKNYLMSSVRLSVHKDWEEVYETDYDTNLMRACAALAVILGMLIIIYIILRMKQNYRSTKYLHFDDNNEEEDDSTEELFNRPSTSGKKKSSSSNNKSPDDFEKVYTTINMAEDV